MKTQASSQVSRNEEPWEKVQEKLDRNRKKLVRLRVVDHADFGRTQDKRLIVSRVQKTLSIQGEKRAF